MPLERRTPIRRVGSRIAKAISYWTMDSGRRKPRSCEGIICTRPRPFSVRQNMRVFRIILVTGLVIFCIVGFLWCLGYVLNPQYFGLRHKSAKFYADYAAACDSVLAAHPLGTNESIKIPVTDPSLPKIMTDLHPVRIVVGSQRVWMLLGSDSHNGFGLTWERGWANSWVLHTTAESHDTVIAASKR